MFALCQFSGYVSIYNPVQIETAQFPNSLWRAVAAVVAGHMKDVVTADEEEAAGLLVESKRQLGWPHSLPLGCYLEPPDRSLGRLLS